jgi:hypothetical protein
VTRQRTVLSSSLDGPTTANAMSLGLAMTPDGSRIVFNSAAADLAIGDCNGSLDVFAIGVLPGVPADSDADGLGDAWELVYFGNLSHDGSADSDHDGMTDAAEYLAGTDPTDPASVLKFVETTRDGGVTRLVWIAGAGRWYHIQYQNLLSDPVWSDSPVAAQVVGNRGFLSDSSAMGPQRFYRIVAGPLPGDLVDSDSDGLDDTWELACFGNLSNDGSADSDHDGMTDATEYLAGTDPTAAASALRILAVTPVGAATELSWLAVPGRVYRVEYKNRLSEPAWSNAPAPVQVLGSRGYIFDTTPPAAARFYRLVVEP